MNLEPLTIFAFINAKYPKQDYFYIDAIADRLSKKLPEIKKRASSRYKYHKIDPIILKEKLFKLIDVLVEKNYKDKRIEECRNILENEDLRYYSQNQNYRFGSDNFHNVFDFYYSDMAKKIQKYKKWTQNREWEVICLLEAVINKKDMKIRESEYYQSIRNFKQAKKQTFLISFDFCGTYDLFDWYGTHNEKIFILISDTTKEAVLARLQHGNNASQLARDMSSKECNYNSYIKNIIFLDKTKENINKAEETLKKRHKYGKKYDKWNCHSKEINLARSSNEQN